MDGGPGIDTLLRLLCEQSGEHAIIFLDPGGRITYFSMGAERIFGYLAEDVVGRPSAALFTPEDVAAGMPEYEMRVAASDGPAEDDRWMRRADGSVFWATGVMVGLRDPEGAVIAYGKLLRNRTDLKEQIESLRNQGRELEGTLRRRDAFLGTLSHELRNPLAPIANAVAIIRQGVPGASPEVAYALRVVERQMHLLDRLVADLMDLTRVGVGKVELRLERVVLQELVAQAIEDLRPQLRERGHRLEVVASDAPIAVMGDRHRLHQIVVNLVVNANKYTPPGGRIRVKASTEADEALLKVEDNGIGIPPEMLPRIFDLFTQVESARPSSQGGLGIGLALVKDLAALHGGMVHVRSDGPGKGSEFTVRLPLAPAGNP